MTQERLLPLLADVLGIDLHALSDDAKMGVTEKWDSLGHLMIMAEIERVYGFRLSTREMVQAASVRELRNLLAARGVA
jgi:acyl carrier protein